ncbi:MAG: glycosyltransferase family 39 protein [Planctomycetes bacterium]|nr:glycosyltransferase family 39 protein [Planctomycetota bacterium]
MMHARKPWLFFLAAALIGIVGAWKPVHMDDAAFVRVAQQMRVAPGDPYGFAWSYLGEPTSASVGLPHPPLWPGALAVALELGGETAFSLHLPSVAALLLLALGLWRWLPGEEDRRARWLILCSPVLVVMGQSSMSDVPALALGVLGLGTWTKAEREQRLRGALAAGLWLAAAGLTRYAALAFAALPLAALLAPGDAAAPSSPWGRRARALLAGGTPLLAALLFQAWFAARYGATHFELLASYLRFEDLRAPELRVLAFLPALAVAFPVGFAVLTAVLGRRVAGGALLAGALLGAWGALRSSAAHGIAWNAPHFALLVLCSAVGLALPLAAARARPRLEERALLGAVLLALLVASPAGAARYVLPLAVLCIVALRAELAALRGPAWRAAIALQLLLAASLALADLRAARGARELYRRASALAERSGAQLWVRGELGLRYELERSGARYLDATERGVEVGDLLVRSERATPADSRFSARVDAALPVAPQWILDASDAFPLRLHQPYAGAGFYGHRAGLLPFAFARAPHELVFVHRFAEAPDLLDLDRAERVGASENSALAEDFARYARVRPAAPRADLELARALHLVARRASGGEMRLRFEVDLPAEPRKLGGRWAEPARLHEDTVPGHASEVELAVRALDGSSRAISFVGRSRARARVEDRRWWPLELDLAPLRGRRVAIEIACRVPADEPVADAVAYAILADLELLPQG